MTGQRGLDRLLRVSDLAARLAGWVTLLVSTETADPPPKAPRL